MNLCTEEDLEVWVWTEIIHVCQLFTNIYGIVANILLLWFLHIFKGKEF